MGRRRPPRSSTSRRRPPSLVVESSSDHAGSHLEDAAASSRILAASFPGWHDAGNAAKTRPRLGPSSPRLFPALSAVKTSFFIRIQIRLHKLNKYIRGGHFSAKSDVYSFGIILLELVSGRLRYSNYTLEAEEDLLAQAWKLWSSGDSSKFVDSAIRGSVSTVDGMRCVQVGLLCVQESSSKRPDMETVITMLNSPSIILPLPTTPWIFDVEISTSRSSADAVESENGAIASALEIDIE